MLADGLARFPQDVRLRQLLALALARTGASRSANQLLGALVAEQHADEETLGMLARTHKDLWSDSTDPQERAEHLRQAYRHYRAAHDASGGYWTGINAATIALLLGDRERAAALAREVRERCERARSDRGGDDPYWMAATLGEAALILGDSSEAEARYAEAAALGRGRFGALASTRRNARLIMQQLGPSNPRIEEHLRVPRAAVFTGHLVDAPGRPVPRFPPGLEPAVQAAIRAHLAAQDVGFGFASAACGADILFLESLLDMGAEAHIVLPYDRDQFRKDSVDIIPGSGWAERYDRVLARASEVVIASPQRMASGGAMAYEYAFLLTDGMAGVRADELDTELVRIALWDGRPGDGPGGTASGVVKWLESNRKVDLIDLRAIRGDGLPPPASTTLPTADALTTTVSGDLAAVASAFEPEIVGILFADARGFSALTEEQIPSFVRNFLGAVADQVLQLPRAPILKNTWGDGLYFVFDRVLDAGLFALRLCETLGRTDWAAFGLPADLGLRIGLHAGPAYACVDPVTGRTNYLGAHVSRAARIEPITPPGQAYASRAFAALARAEQGSEFRCEYVGQTPLAKGYGTYPTYVVRRKGRL